MSGWGEAAFNPRRVALVGASAEPGKAGRLFLDNLRAGLSDALVPISSAARVIDGRPAYASLAEAPGPIDLAVIVTPAETIVGVIEDCGRAQVPVAVIVTGGFAETGAAGASLERDVVAAARAGGVRLIGPNCFGLINVRSHLNASMAMGLPAPGGVSLFTQSGAYGMAAYSRSTEGAIGFCKVLAAGNKADIDEVDAVRYFGGDPETRVIALVLESLGDGAALVAALRAVSPRKPVVILKTGRSQAGIRAAASHTAAMAQDFAVTSAVLRQAGAIMVEDGLTLFDVASALDRQPPMRGRRVGIISNSGGVGVELADLLEAEGLTVPVLTPALQREIARHLPAHGSSGNPIDVTTAWSRFAQMYRESLGALLASEEVDAVIPVLLQRSALDEKVGQAVIDAAHGGAKPVHVSWFAPPAGEAIKRRLQASGVPCHDWAARTARVLARCRVAPLDPVPETGPILECPRNVPADGWLPPGRLFSLLEGWGLPVAPWRIAESADAAAAAATELGYPAVLKAIRPGLVHKSEAGAVRLGLDDAGAVRAAFAAFEAMLGPGPALVQGQAARGLELVVGAVRDATFGPILLCGLGGIWTQALGDVSIRLAPISPAGAMNAVKELRGRALIEGYRGAPGVDLAALGALVSALSLSIARAPWCVELDLNPVLASGDRFVIVDARMRVEGGS